MTAHVQLDRDVIADFCRRNHIRRLSLFGSVLTDRFRPDSDVDVLRLGVRRQSRRFRTAEASFGAAAMPPLLKAVAAATALQTLRVEGEND